MKAGGLEFLAEKLKDNVADEAGDDGNHEICSRENIVECEGQGLSVSVRVSEFAHQEIGVEKEDDEADFNDGPPKRGQLSVVARICHHLLTGEVEALQDCV